MSVCPHGRGGRGGTYLPSGQQGRGVLTLDGGTPVQVRSQVKMGEGVPTLDGGRGYLPWMGYPQPGQRKGVPTLDGERGYLPWTGGDSSQKNWICSYQFPPPPTPPQLGQGDNSTASSCHAASSMPLGFTQEDFLVLGFFCFWFFLPNLFYLSLCRFLSPNLYDYRKTRMFKFVVSRA